MTPTNLRVWTTDEYQPFVVTSADGSPIFTVNEDGTWTGTVESLDDLARVLADLFPRRGHLPVSAADESGA